MFFDIAPDCFVVAVALIFAKQFNGDQFYVALKSVQIHGLEGSGLQQHF